MIKNRIVIYFYVFLYAFLCFAPAHFTGNYLLAVLAVYFYYKLKANRFPTSYGNRFFQLFLVLSLIQSFCSGTISRSLYVFFKYLFVYLAFVDLHYFVDKDTKEKIQLLWLYLSIPLLFLGVYQSFFVDIDMPLNWYNHLAGAPSINRAFGLFNNPNIFGSFTLILSLYSLLKDSDNKNIKKSLIFITIFLALVCVFTLSRGAVLSLLIGIVLVALSHREKRSLAILLLILICVSFHFSGRSTGVAEVDLGANQRVELYKGVKQYISTHWLQGTGPGTFHINYPSYRTLGGYYPLYAHNQLLEIWCEGGVLAFTLILLSLAFLFLNITLSSQILLIACLSNSMVNSSYSFFIIVLMVIGFLEQKQSKTDLQKVPKFVGVTVFILLAVFMSYQEFKRKVIVNKKIVSSKKLIHFVDQDYEFAIQFIKQRLKMKLNKDTIFEYIDWLNSFTKTMPRESETFYVLGQLAEKAKQSRVAYAFYKQSLRLDRFSEKNAIAVIRLSGYFKDYDYIQKVVDRVLYSNYQYRKINALYDQIQYFYIVSLIEQKKDAEAKAFFNKCIWVDDQFKENLAKNLFKEN
ncbi:MAG: O-antigen ligase family protein [Candidatus Cloacimonetes bacterium]|nr:O-antigen ligase family protein [Candidatus Cloacimonadota bacterium]